MRGILCVGAIVLLSCGGGGGGGDEDTDPDRDGSRPDVEMVGEGEALVSWDAPTTRADGTELMPASLGGYRVHYGTATRTYDTTIDVGRTTSHRISGLAPDTTYFFAVTAYDISMRESDFSAEAEKAL